MAWTGLQSLGLVVHPADVQDRNGAPQVLGSLRFLSLATLR